MTDSLRTPEDTMNLVWMDQLLPLEDGNLIPHQGEREGKSDPSEVMHLSGHV